MRAVLSLQNTLQPRGQISNNTMTADIITNDQISRPADYKPLIVGYHNGNAVRLSDVTEVVDSTQNMRTAGYIDGTPSVTVIIFRQPGANIIQHRRAHSDAVAVFAGGCATGDSLHHRSRPHHHHPRLG